MKNSEQKGSFTKFASVRIFFGLIVVVTAVAALSLILGFFGKAPSSEKKQIVAVQKETPKEPSDIPKQEPAPHQPAEPKPHDPAPVPVPEPVRQVPVEKKPELPVIGRTKAAKGVAFVDALIRPMDYELNKRFWGWRLNDILVVTDNVNNIQRGVLEVTRRTTMILNDKISRTGSTAAIDQNLERAMNWFMIKAEQYWFPSAESKYKEGLEELRRYKSKLENRTANFYTRADNIVPLLIAYEDLLGSCDENLAKTREEDGTPVSFFKADDYLYYAKGVTIAMASVLEAIDYDFHDVISSVYSTEVLEHAIESCHEAGNIDPWIVLESDLSSIFANHRANMALRISHARFYVGLLIKAITT